MVELKTAEQVAYFLKAHISLSRYDSKFIDSIMSIKQVTTNQVELFYKIIYKYRRQLAKHNLDPDVLIYLPWAMNVVESVGDYTDGHIEIKDGNIYFKCPFNRAFINDFRKFDMNTYVWSKEHRRYESPYSTYALKILCNTASRFYKVIRFCDTTLALLEGLTKYENTKYWQPTLVMTGSKRIIASINESLNNALGDKNIDEMSIAEIASYGIHIEGSYSNPKDKFMSEMNTTIEVDDLLNIVPWLQEMNCDMVYFSGSSNAPISPIKKQFSEELKNLKIPYIDTGIYTIVPPATDFNTPVLIRFKKSLDVMFDPYKVSKIVHLVNSKAIDIK